MDNNTVGCASAGAAARAERWGSSGHGARSVGIGVALLKASARNPACYDPVIGNQKTEALHRIESAIKAEGILLFVFPHKIKINKVDNPTTNS